MKVKVFKISLSIFVVIGLSLLLSTPLPAEQKAIKVYKTDKAVNGVGVDDPIWMEVPLQDISLMTAPPVHPAVSGTAAVLKLTVQAVQDKEKLYIKLRWQDGSYNAQIRGLKDYKDAVSVQFPIDKSKATNIIMGQEGKGVTIWRWAADNIVESLSAEGFGTLSPSHSQYLNGVGVYRDGGWTVVLSRSLAAPASGEIAFDKTIPVAFAVWDGGNRERDGLKAVTFEWVEMQF